MPEKQQLLIDTIANKSAKDLRKLLHSCPKARLSTLLFEKNNHDETCLMVAARQKDVLQKIEILIHFIKKLDLLSQGELLTYCNQHNENILLQISSHYYYQCANKAYQIARQIINLITQQSAETIQTICQKTNRIGMHALMLAAERNHVMLQYLRPLYKKAKNQKIIWMQTNHKKHDLFHLSMLLSDKEKITPANIAADTLLLQMLLETQDLNLQHEILQYKHHSACATVTDLLFRSHNKNTTLPLFIEFLQHVHLGSEEKEMLIQLIMDSRILFLIAEHRLDLLGDFLNWLKSAVDIENLHAILISTNRYGKDVKTCIQKGLAEPYYFVQLILTVFSFELKNIKRISDILKLFDIAQGAKYSLAYELTKRIDNLSDKNNIERLKDLTEVKNSLAKYQRELSGVKKESKQLHDKIDRLNLTGQYWFYASNTGQMIGKYQLKKYYSLYQELQTCKSKIDKYLKQDTYEKSKIKQLEIKANNIIAKIEILPSREAVIEGNVIGKLLNPPKHHNQFGKAYQYAQNQNAKNKAKSIVLVSSIVLIAVTLGLLSANPLGLGFCLILGATAAIASIAIQKNIALNHAIAAEKKASNQFKKMRCLKQQQETQETGNLPSKQTAPTSYAKENKYGFSLLARKKPQDRHIRENTSIKIPR